MQKWLKGYGLKKVVAEEIYKQYESGDIAETWNQDKRNVV